MAAGRGASAFEMRDVSRRKITPERDCCNPTARIIRKGIKCYRQQPTRRDHMMRSGSLALLIALGSLVAAPDAEAETGISWSGYAIKSADLGSPTPPTAFTAVSAMWTQPAVTCPLDNAKVSFWVGIDGDGTRTVEQAGTLVTCSATNQPPVYQAFWEMYDANGGSHGAEPFNVSPGDVIQASASYVGGVSYLLEVTDLTSGASFSTTQSCNANIVCKRGTAEWIVERPGSGSFPLADYGTVEFVNALETHSGPTPARVEINMVDVSTTLSACGLIASGRPLPDFSTPFWNFTNGFACHWLAAN
jgi:hypothetical protein